MEQDSLRDLARATQAFYARFGITPQRDSSIIKLKEETGELIEAALDGTNPDHIAEEAVDVLVTALSVCYAAGVDTERFIQQVYAVIAKNEAKDRTTHIAVDGIIRRRRADDPAE